MRLIDNAWQEFHRVWSNRASIWLGFFTGVSAISGAFIDVLNPWLLLGLVALVNIAVIPVLRVIKQREPAKSPQAAAEPVA